MCISTNWGTEDKGWFSHHDLFFIFTTFLSFPTNIGYVSQRATAQVNSWYTTARTHSHALHTHSHARSEATYMNTYTTHGWQTEATYTLNITACVRWCHMIIILVENNRRSYSIVTSAGLHEKPLHVRTELTAVIQIFFFYVKIFCSIVVTKRMNVTLVHCATSRRWNQETGPHFLYACHSWTIETWENIGWSDDSRFLVNKCEWHGQNFDVKRYESYACT